MIAQNLTAVVLEIQPAQENQTGQCTINLLFRNILTKTSKMPVFKSLIKLERKTQSTSQSLGTGKLISKKMRTKLIGWMEKLALETFEFSAKTLLLAIKILDEYLCLTNQTPSTLQLIGCACLFLAAKTSEIVIIASQCYVTASANCFTEKNLLNKEIEIYKTLNYDTTFSCLTKVYKYMKQNFGTQNLKNYKISEIERVFLQIAKNLDFKQFREHQIVSMLIAAGQIQKKIISSSQLLPLLKSYSVY